MQYVLSNAESKGRSPLKNSKAGAQQEKKHSTKSIKLFLSELNYLGKTPLSPSTRLNTSTTIAIFSET
jgi:hypothetical protein